VRYVIRALREAETVDRIILIAPSGFPEEPDADSTVVGQGDIAENIAAGLEACADAEYVVIVSADVPFITPEAVDDYTRICAATGADCCYAAVTRESCSKHYPSLRRTYLKTTSGTVTGGNVVVQRASTFARQADVLRRAHRRRKNPLFLAGLIGGRNVLKFLAGRLAIEDIEKSASRLMDVTCRLIVTDHAELGTDVDRPSDLAAARSLLQPTRPLDRRPSAL